MADVGLAGRLPLASLGKRLGAATIDFVIGYLKAVPAFLISTTGHDPFSEGLRSHLVPWPLPSAPVNILSSFPVLALQAWLIATRGQSVGKALVGIQILTLDGRVAGLRQGFLLRWLPFLALVWLSSCLGYLGISALLSGAVTGVISALQIIDVLFIFSGSRRCLHDHLAGTRVVDCGTRTTGQ